MLLRILLVLVLVFLGWSCVVQPALTMLQAFIWKNFWWMLPG